MDKSIGKESDTTAANEPTSPAVTAAVGTTTTLSGAPSAEPLSTVGRRQSTADDTRSRWYPPLPCPHAIPQSEGLQHAFCLCISFFKLS